MVGIVRAEMVIKGVHNFLSALVFVNDLNLLVLICKQILHVDGTFLRNSEPNFVLDCITFFWEDSWLDFEAPINGGLPCSHVVFELERLVERLKL